MHLRRHLHRDLAGITPASIENLWLRLRAGDRVRPRDALLLRKLAIPPFENGLLFELDINGYVIGIGFPDDVKEIEAHELLAAFEARVGVPRTFYARCPETGQTP